MCGIAGIVDYRSPSIETLERIAEAMSQAIAHRGPDDRGSYVNRHVALGHRRLSIIDPSSAGRQPFVDDSRRFALVFNGEIYNFAALKARLEQLGSVFRTRTDTEVLLHAYLQWGESCLDELNGDFAFAVWDAREERMFFARDRMGVKPFYYALVGGRFAFASELKALLSIPELPRKLDAHALVETFMSLQPIAPRSLLEAVQCLPAGHCGTWSASGLTLRRYWDIPALEHHDSPADSSERVRELLADATRLRLVSDVPLCGLLSGGVDSSAICALAAQSVDQPLRTFTVTFDGTRRRAPQHTHGEDADYASLVARAIGADHRELRIGDESLLAAAREPMRARDLPTSMGQEIGIDRLFRQISAHARVALSGEAADEVCAGYYFFLSAAAVRGETNPLLLGAQTQDARALMFSPKFRRQIDPDVHLTRCFHALRDAAPNAGHDARDRAVKRLQYVQIKHFLPYLLDRVDRISMASAVEVRVPFCDHRLVEYAFNIPYDIAAAGGVEKALLRRAVLGLLPAEVAERKKSIFPYSISVRALEVLWAVLSDLLESEHFALRQLFNPPYLQRWYERSCTQPEAAIGFQGTALAVITFHELCQRFNLYL